MDFGMIQKKLLSAACFMFSSSLNQKKNLSTPLGRTRHHE
jgi:hypothetical protein